MWWCWHEMLAINIKRGMSTHVAEGKLHCPPPEFPSQVEGPFPDLHHARNGENAKESSNGGGICKNDLQTKIIILTSPLTKDILVHISRSTNHLVRNAIYQTSEEQSEE